MKVERHIPAPPPATYNGLRVKPSAEIRALLKELRSGLEELYGDRLRGVYLFGSYARGEADAEVDVLIVLDQVESYSAEVKRAGHLAAELSLKYEISVGNAFTTEEAWEHPDMPFLSNVRREAVAL